MEELESGGKLVSVGVGRVRRVGGGRKKIQDFPSLAQGKALPYGVYDTGQNRAVVNVGVTHDTAEFAVESIRR